jgi:hypothetical protein
MPTKPAKDCAPGLYSRRRPAETPLYQVVQKYFETFRVLCQDDWEGQSMPAYAEREFRRYLECGALIITPATLPTDHDILRVTY